MNEKQLSLEMVEHEEHIGLETYEAMMKELDEALKIVEDSKSNLADVITAYDKGIKAHKKCVEILNNIEQKVVEIAKNK